MMKCTYCKDKIEKTWSYCPRCGHRIESNRNIMDIVGERLDKLKNIFFPSKYKTKITEPPEISVSIVAGGFGFLTPTEPLIAERGPIPYRAPIKFEKTTIVEPKTEVVTSPNRVVIDIELPFVKTEDDIELNVFQNSVEIKAKAGEYGYFKIIKIPDNFKPVDKKFKDGKLRLVLSG